MKKLIPAILLMAFVALAAWLFWSSSDDYLLKANADGLKSTIVTPHLECRIEGDQDSGFHGAFFVQSCNQDRNGVLHRGNDS